MTNSSDYYVEIPIVPKALTKIEEMLIDADVFTTTFQELGDGRYRAETYLRESVLHETRLVVHYDRNIFTRLLDLAGDREVTRHHRVVAAVQAFAQTTGMEIEPNLALYEVEASAKHARPNEELRTFRRLDNTHPQLFADIATGKRMSLPTDEIPDVEQGQGCDSPPSFRKPLRTWKASYIAVLKIAQLKLSGLRPKQKFIDLMNWMEKDYIFLAPAILLANRFLSSNSEHRRLIKKLESPVRERAIAGLKNAAWDLAVISEWAKKATQQADEKSLRILVSADRALQSLARQSLVTAAADDALNARRLLHRDFVGMWGNKTESEHLKRYEEIQNRILSEMAGDSGRSLEPNYIEALREQLETEILSHRF